MNYDKFAAHYILSPEGQLIKWPVITIRKDGVILEVKNHNTAFREEHGVMFYSGILLPAFIDIWWKYPQNIEKDIATNISDHFNMGTLLLGFPHSPQKSPTFPNTNGPILFNQRFPYSHPEIFPDLTTDNTLPIFKRIKKILRKNKNIELHKILAAATSEAAIITNHPELGRLEAGCSPGLILLQNADLVNFKMTPQTTIKWLMYPSIKSLIE